MRYIPDKEINLLEEDLLGTSSYVHTLYEIIHNCETPFTIGLFGGWGTGKSSIVKTLKEKIEKEKQNEFKVITYDAWKYSNDSFRRTFILELTNSLALKPKKEWNKVFYQDELEEKEFKFKFNKYWYIYVAPIVLILAFILGLWFTSAEKDLKILSTIIGVIASILIFLVSNLFILQKTTLIQSKIFSPEQFEEIFLEILGKTTPYKSNTSNWIASSHKINKFEKLVIIIDNLDRCRKETAVELMLSVKNFLEKEYCIFILPVDNNAIKNFLELESRTKESKLSKVDGDEFLRKFFNTSLIIKELTNFELYDFTLKLKEKYNLEFSNETLSIITQEFAKNPRRIIQFINNLITEWRLIVETQKLGFLHSKEVTEKIEFIAKLLIIREEWPDLFAQIVDDYRILRLINEKISSTEISKSLKFPLNISEDLSLTKEQYYFFIRTKAIKSENIEPFIRIKDMLKDLPDELEKLILEQNWDDVKKFLGEEISFNSLLDYTRNLFDREIIQRRLLLTSGYNILSFIMKMSLDDDFQNEYNIHFRKIASFFDFQYLAPVIELLSPTLITRFAKLNFEKGETSILQTIIHYAKQTNNEEPTSNLRKELTIEIVRNFIEFPDVLTQIKNEFASVIENNEEILSTLDDILDQSERIGNLISKKLIEYFLKTIVANPEQRQTIRKVKLILSLKYLTNYKDFERQFAIKALQFANTNNLNIMKYWYEQALNFISKDNSQILQQAFNVVNARQNFIVQRINSSQFPLNEEDEEILKIHIQFINKLFIISETHRPQLSNMLLYFFNPEKPNLFRIANENFNEILDTTNINNWPFARGIFNVFKNASDFPKKETAALTLLKMLENSKSLDILEASLITEITAELFSLLLSGSQKISKLSETIIRRLMEVPHLSKIIENQIRINISTKSTKVVKLLVNLSNEESKNRLVSNILLSPENLEEIPEIVHKTIGIGDEGKKLIKKLLSKIIKQINIEKREHYIKILELCVKYIDLFNQAEKNTIIIKISPLLSYGYEEKIIALNLLNRIEDIPQKATNVISASLESIDGFDNKSDNKLFNDVKEKYQVQR
ncbi:MAG: KAP family P-loop NTPase fold protein [Candidatus Heimdallarchaeaceae archaeon]